MRRFLWQPPERRPRGQALLLAVIVLVITATMTTTIAQTTLQRYQQCDRVALATQADCIAESALVRGLHALESNADYAGETWNVIVAGPDGGSAQVIIASTPNGIQVDVLFPVDAPVASQVRLHREVPR